jgi:hypothetical protein
MADCDKRLGGKQKEAKNGEERQQGCCEGWGEEWCSEGHGLGRERDVEASRRLGQELKEKAVRHEGGGGGRGSEKLQNNVKGRERVAQAFGRVDTSGYERIESSEEHLCIRNSRREILGYSFVFLRLFFRTFKKSAAALHRICCRTHF